MVASLAIVSVLVMALASTLVVSRRDVRRPWAIGAVLLTLLIVSYFLPIGRVTFSTRAAESLFYAALYFSPIFCAGLLFGSAIKRSRSIARDYGVNLLGAMAGGVVEYISLVSGYRALLLIVAALYLAALVARQTQRSQSISP